MAVQSGRRDDHETARSLPLATTTIASAIKILLVVTLTVIAFTSGLISSPAFRSTQPPPVTPYIPSPVAPIVNVTILEPTTTPKPIPSPTEAPQPPDPPFPPCDDVDSGESCVFIETPTPVGTVAPLPFCNVDTRTIEGFPSCRKP